MAKKKLKPVRWLLDKLDDWFINTPGKELSRSDNSIFDALNRLDRFVFSFIRGGPRRRRLKRTNSRFLNLLNRVDYWFFRFLDRIDTKLIYKGRMVRTKSGLRVRSAAERCLAEELDRHGISYRYECPLVLDGITLHPDFYLTKEKVFIELWGLTRYRSYVRIMNRKKLLYNKHGIPVISIYMKDMKNLESNLAKLYQKATGKKFPTAIV